MEQSDNKVAVKKMGVEEKQLSRRNFLKIIGATSAVTATGCADKVAETVIPFVNPVQDQIPGVAVWYNSTCTECSAGCGIQVRTREGRAVKVEGNKEHPINRGGVCALGHSSLQDLYDPDRIRQPLIRDDAGNFKPASWNEALAVVNGKAKELGKNKSSIFTGELSGSLDSLFSQLGEQWGAKRATFEPTAPSNEAQAAKLVYGVNGIPQYHFDKAEVILNFGADFLETWVSPCEYARDWAKTRKGKTPCRVFHVEPRLSLTGASADHWLNAKVGTEVDIALVILKLLVDKGRGSRLGDETLSKIRAIVKGVSLNKVARTSGVSRDKILSASQYLFESKSSLVLAGGVASASNNPLPLLVVANLINLVLGNVGKTIDLGVVRTVKSDIGGVQKIIDGLKAGEIGMVLFYKANPNYALPASFEFEYALRKAEMVVSLSSHMDETTAKANVILPINSFLEDWGYTKPIKGVHNLNQPTMLPIWDTRGAGDVLIDLIKVAGGDVGALTHQEYIQLKFKELYEGSGASGDFRDFWTTSVQNGGYFKPNTEMKAGGEIDTKIYSLDYSPSEIDDEGGKNKGDLILLPFTSVRTFDGRAANRPWLHEVPDPISQVAWDSWAEMHPKTAKKFGLAKGDVVTLRNFYGELNMPIYITDYINEGVVGVPLGAGHSELGRFAKISQGNAFQPIPKVIGKNTSASIALISAKVAVSRSRLTKELLNVQGGDSQLGRELARTKFIDSGNEDHGHSHGHAHHHEPKQMYEQREHPLYKWGMAVDLAACTGCSACVVACYAENNIAVVGRDVMAQGREMSWLRIERYHDGTAEELKVSFLPMMCQHCNNAPCEPVCPVYATYHNEEGLNAMVYNRCVGTRYCSNNCSYKVRRYNWFEYEWPEPTNWQLNPDVTPRGPGVMEKCTFCVQRISEGKDRAKDLGRPVLDGEVSPACVQSCPTEALAFGNLNDPNSKVSKLSASGRAYKVLDHHLNTQPSVTYLEDIKYKV